MGDNAIGMNLRAARKRLGLKAKEVAARVQREPQTIYRWEWGTSIPTVKELAMLAEVYGTTVSELASGFGVSAP